jgi:hypothetical protein
MGAIRPGSPKRIIGRRLTLTVYGECPNRAPGSAAVACVIPIYHGRLRGRPDNADYLLSVSNWRCQSPFSLNFERCDRTISRAELKPKSLR